MLPQTKLDAVVARHATIEADLARNAASRVTAEEASELKKLARVKVAGDSRSQLDNFVEADRAFHTRFAELAGNPVMSDIAGKLHMLRVECTHCSRKGKYNVAELIAQYGLRGNMTAWMHAFKNDCPNRNYESIAIAKPSAP